MLAGREQDVELALCRVRRYLVRELEQVIGYSCHRGDDRDDLATLALCFKEPAGNFLNTLRLPDGSAAIFLNHQAHVRCRLNPKEGELRWFSSVGYSPIACPTSIAPRDLAIAPRACFQLAGFPIRIADATVSGFSIMRL